MQDYAKRIRELEEQDRQLGLKRDAAKALKTNQAMEKGVVGSGQVSQEAFSKNRSASNTDKAAAALSISESITGESVGTSVAGGGETGGALDGAGQGAMTAAAMSGGNPYAMAAGAVIGAVQGVANSREAKRAHNAQVEAQKQRALGEIEEQKGRDISNALGMMGQRMGQSFR